MRMTERLPLTMVSAYTSFNDFTPFLLNVGLLRLMVLVVHAATHGLETGLFRWQQNCYGAGYAVLGILLFHR